MSRRKSENRVLPMTGGFPADDPSEEEIEFRHDALAGRVTARERRQMGSYAPEEIDALAAAIFLEHAERGLLAVTVLRRAAAWIHAREMRAVPQGRTLTAGDVAEMRRLRSEGEPIAALAERFGVSESNVSRVTVTQVRQEARRRAVGAK